MGLIISAITTIILGLSLAVNPVKSTNGTQAAATNVTANTSVNETQESNNQTLTVNTDTNAEENITANATDDSKEKDNELQEGSEIKGKEKGKLKISAFNNKSGSVMPSLIPKIAVDHSGSLDVSSNTDIEEGK